jgi:hypothetical protein
MAQAPSLLLFLGVVATESASDLVFLPGICIRHAAAVNYIVISMKPFAGFNETICFRVGFDIGIR